jgi:hypothetical protein
MHYLACSNLWSIQVKFEHPSHAKDKARAQTKRVVYIRAKKMRARGLFHRNRADSAVHVLFFIPFSPPLTGLKQPAHIVYFRDDS